MIQWAISSTVVLSIMAVPMAVALFFADSVASVIFQQPAHISVVRSSVFKSRMHPGVKFQF